MEVLQDVSSRAVKDSTVQELSSGSEEEATSESGSTEYETDDSSEEEEGSVSSSEEGTYLTDSPSEKSVPE